MYHQADVRDYKQLATVFDNVFSKTGRLDFVFANAGIAETKDFFALHSDGGIPPEPCLDTVHINLDGVLYTSYLAMHSFRRYPESTKGKRSLIMTSSIGGLHPCVLAPIYSASKHAIVGFARSIGDKLWVEGIRVNAICPGVVKTALLTDELKLFFQEDIIIPLEVVTDLVLELFSGDPMTDMSGTHVSADHLHKRCCTFQGEIIISSMNLNFMTSKAGKPMPP